MEMKLFLVWVPVPLLCMAFCGMNNPLFSEGNMFRKLILEKTNAHLANVSCCSFVSIILFFILSVRLMDFLQNMVSIYS